MVTRMIFLTTSAMICDMNPFFSPNRSPKSMNARVSDMREWIGTKKCIPFAASTSFTASARLDDDVSDDDDRIYSPDSLSHRIGRKIR